MIAGEVSAGRELLADARRLKPDLVLLDWALGGLGALEALRALDPAPAVIVLIAGADPEYCAAGAGPGRRGLPPPRTPPPGVAAGLAADHRGRREGDQPCIARAACGDPIGWPAGGRRPEALQELYARYTSAAQALADSLLTEAEAG